MKKSVTSALLVAVAIPTMAEQVVHAPKQCAAYYQTEHVCAMGLADVTALSDPERATRMLDKLKVDEKYRLQSFQEQIRSKGFEGAGHYCEFKLQFSRSDWRDAYERIAARGHADVMRDCADAIGIVR
ncbi:hypothetical protein [Paraburkholderia unamae]|uniref:Uncharacterized protein n=1 Tax=Paraburkholderia unamae TaxID=219649 RepID=A0ACC6RX54_9BURK